ncbi:META domain-containing protein [Pararhodobacter zhoushanensis]|uniref:META domain-containing protein n=1 Tax=Pararhodobacter zhoushanensis TaxID=2479545 RepID=A0ABT3H556_9RHOB|nr:META domain-containing protein [Pararhodobacter zhoushanensis]MCW1934870.1 META domain-containing protein [Pararhodobacter zhoushanensis]
MLRPFLRAAALVLTLASPAAAELVSMQAVQPATRVGIDPSGRLSLHGGTAMTLDMVQLEGNRVAFRDPQSGLFLRAGVGAQTELAIASPHIRSWETFELIPNGPGFALRSVQNGMYVGADPANPRLAAVWGTRGMGQTYLLQPVGQTRPFLPVRPAAPQDYVGGWQLETLYRNGRPVALDPQAIAGAYMNIARLGAVEGNSSCNQFDARIGGHDDTIVVRNIITTRRACGGDVRQVENLFYQSLQEVRRFVMLQGSGRLDMRDANGTLLASLRRR